VALKDLIASKATLTEETIEAIVSDYVRYDVDHKEIALTTAGVALPAKKKVLMYLVALQGWPLLVKEAVPTDASPGELGDRLGVPGGTIRPMLMDLSDRHLIVGKKGRYSVRAASLSSIKAELGSKDAGHQPSKRPARPQRKTKATDGTSASGQRRNAKSAKTGSHTARFEGWIDNGYFDQPRTLSDVTKKFRQAGVIVAQTSMPQLFLKFVRNGRLDREETEVGGKRVWVYERAK
jgi:hypothetical protein